MSEIKAGDLVVVVRPTLCCGVPAGLGRIGTIIDGYDRHSHMHCPLCLVQEPHSKAITVKAAFGDDVGYIHLVRIRRIPPLSELEDILREVTA